MSYFDDFSSEIDTFFNDGFDLFSQVREEKRSKQESKEDRANTGKWLPGLTAFRFDTRGIFFSSTMYIDTNADLNVLDYRDHPRICPFCFV
jgi:hypothetical protein